MEIFAKQWHRGITQQEIHLSRHAWKCDHEALACGCRKCGCSPDWIRNGDGACWDICLPAVDGFGHAPVVLEAILDLCPKFGFEDQLNTERPGDAFARGIIDRWAQATGGDHDFCTLDGFLHSFSDAASIIPHGHRTIKVHARIKQGAGDLLGISVDDLTQQQLGPDGKDFGVRHSDHVVFLNHAPFVEACKVQGGDIDGSWAAFQ